MSQQKSTDNQLQLNRNLAELDNIYDTAPIGLCFMDTDLKYVRINKALAEINGMPVEAHIGRTLRQVLPPALVDVVESLYQQVLDTGQPITNQEIHGTTAAQPNVERIWLGSYYPIKDENGLIFGINTVVQEITERKQAEVQNEYLTRLMESIPDAVISTDTNFQVLTWNQAAEETYGWTASEAIGASVTDLLKTDFLSTSGDAVRAQFATKGHWQGEVIQYHKDGTPLSILNSTTLLKQVDNQIVGAVAVNRDITEYKQTQRALLKSQAQLRELNEQLEQRVAERTQMLERSNQMLDRFAYIASHDLKAPLQAIDRLASWIIEDAGDTLSAPARTHLPKLRGRVKRMQTMLEDLLVFAQLDNLEAQPTEIDTTTLVQDIIELLGPPPEFTVSIQQPMPVITAAKAPLALVFRNLINNAIKHHHQPTGHIKISAQETDQAFIFSVSDDGPGITEQYRQRIFQPFQTLKPRDQVEGSGMGLAIAKKIVEAQGGVIDFKQAEGTGTVFYFSWQKE